MIKFETKNAFLQEDITSYQDEVTKLHDALMNKTGKGNDFLGWVDWCNNYDKAEFERVKQAASYIKENCDVFLVCGIGGSYLGARAAIEMINGLYADKKPEIIFCGNTFSSTYTKQVLDYIKDKDVCLNVISKSGTTTETALAFRLFKQAIEEKYGKEEASKRIVATTDGAKGTLYELAKKEGYDMYVIPDDIGGRFSVITPVGLLPIAVAGIDIDELMNGVTQAYNDFNTADLTKNPAYAYAVARRILEKQGKSAEMFVTYDLQTTMLAEWWKQLFGESEGKNGCGLLPTSATFSTDLHSLGQFVQDGKKLLFETLVLFEKPTEDIIFPNDDDNLDSMNYLAGKNVDWVNKMAMKGTLQAHVETGKVPNLEIIVPDMSAYSFGYLVYFFFRACAMTVYLIDQNPFDQPGVEVYKKNMFKLLGKN
ncbi:glucose-6-phosphate isomerase [Breznakia sp. PF5-3]|uniref:glucose-6-phosphate isomerase n=1 Tax=unclassified Breznakia TaxID=2623764 RepID=UPI002405EE5C|nr:MULTISPECIES: glucose-6-phosphate isomerase [unclassified Breznakia]MDF9823749.1 glucose-6-phosphate isomerase [Breznakia sp. PM6-1]MDF9834547.1 glucose-6-phosphate isomerase [Breznakia sp. PF5-3]MDF9838260.1 glucose-6-phosphate isomerase [Breznakia sp. PFB2-8]MDF9860276.1 glucose-6-phosphate isomerase [Breznakia sp. PH5-24]